MAGIPSGEIRNDNIRNTTQPSFEPAINIAILSKTPMPESISMNVFAQQNRNVKSGVISVSTTTIGAAIILNGSLIIVIKIPLSWLNIDVLSYTYILPF